MALNFPNTPAINDTYVNGNAAWRWDGGKWFSTQSPIGSSGGASVTISDIPPATPTSGSLWWDSVSGNMYLWYDDLSSQQWVPVMNLPGSTGFVLKTGDAMTGPLSVTVPDGTFAYQALFAGTTRGVRFVSSSTGTAIEGTDQTGTGSGPLTLNAGTSLTFRIGGTQVGQFTSTGLALNAPLPIASGGSGSTTTAGAPWVMDTGDIITGQITINPNAQAVVIGTEGLRVAGTSGTTAAILRTYNWGQPAYYASRAYGGSSASPSATALNSPLGGLQLEGYDGTTAQLGAAIRADARETWSGSTRSAGFIFQTTPPGSTTITETLRVGQGLMVGTFGNFTNDPGVGGIYQTGPHIINQNAAALPTPDAPNLQIGGADGALAGLEIAAFGNIPVFETKRANGTNTARTPPLNNEWLYIHQARGAINASVYAVGGELYCSARENWTPTANGCNWVFTTRAPGTTTAEYPVIIGRGLIVGGSIANDPGPGGIALVGPIADPLSLQSSSNWSRVKCVSTQTYTMGALNNGDFAVSQETGTGGYAISIQQNTKACFNVTGTWNATSDARVKRDVSDYQTGLAQLLQLRPVSFYFNGTADMVDDGVQHFGLIAQEVELIVPEIVATRTYVSPPDPDTGEQKSTNMDLMTVDPARLVYAVVNAIKELNAEIQALKAGAAP